MDGIIFLGMIFSIFSGKKSLGKFNFKSRPYSEVLKKVSFGLAKYFEDPIFPLAAISKVSAPLKIFRIEREVFPEIPKS